MAVLMLPAMKLKSIIRKTWPPLADAVGYYDACLARAAREGPVWVVLLYHRVLDDESKDVYPSGTGMCVSRDSFESHMRTLVSAWEPVSVSEVVGRFREDRPVPDLSFSVTFDDGYVDNLTNALPILRQYGVPATFFVATGGLETGQSFWWDRLLSVVAASSRDRFSLAEIGLGRESEMIELRSTESDVELKRLIDCLWAVPVSEIDDAVDSIEKLLVPEGKTGEATRCRMTAAEVAELAEEEGMEIGAHTVSHINAAIATDGAFRKEAAESKSYLEDLCGTKVHGFSYPGGRTSQTSWDILEDLDYDYAVTVEQGICRELGNRFSLPRVTGQRYGGADLKRLILKLVHRQD